MSDSVGTIGGDCPRAGGPLSPWHTDHAPSPSDFNPKKFITKDSGDRVTFGGGMCRDVTSDKMRPDLVKAGPMFMRWVLLLTRGAVKYVADNWMKAKGKEEYDRFLESFDRHAIIWFMWRKFGINIEDPYNPTREPLTEDHAAAIYFNINGAEYMVEQGYPTEWRKIHEDVIVMKNSSYFAGMEEGRRQSVTPA